MDKNLKIWDIVSGACRSVCVHNGSVVALKWHKTLPVICSAALDNIVRIWDARNGSMLLALSGHRDLVTNFEVSTVLFEESNGAKKDLIATVSDDGTSKIFLLDMNSLIS
jgi:WD40 repeat protein